jgi:hypothetical protein
LDSVVGANYEQKDLSSIITMQDGPDRPVLKGLKKGQNAKGKTHYWDEVGLNKPGYGRATYPEGGKPPGDTNPPVQLSNTVCRIGKIAKVTDTMAAIWTGSGSYSLADGELERLYSEAMDIQVALKSTEVLNEAEWMLINGDAGNPEAWQGGQCDGILKWIRTNVIVAGTTSSPFSVAKTNAANFEIQCQVLAQQIRGLYTPTIPDLWLATTPQKGGINSFVGGGAGRPIVQIINSPDNTFTGGQEVDEWQSGFFKLPVKVAPQLEIAATAGKNVPAVTGTTVFLDTNHFSRSDLIPFHAEPLARIESSLERMMTWEFTLEARNEKSSGKITGLSG